MVSLGHLKQGEARCSFTFPGRVMLAWWALITSGWTSSLLFAFFSPKIRSCSCPPRKQDMRTALFLAHRESLCLNRLKSRTRHVFGKVYMIHGILNKDVKSKVSPESQRTIRSEI